MQWVVPAPLGPNKNVTGVKYFYANVGGCGIKNNVSVLFQMQLCCPRTKSFNIVLNLKSAVENDCGSFLKHRKCLLLVQQGRAVKG